MIARSQLKLVSFDGGGERSISQLETMGTIMHRIRSDKYPNEPEKIMLPHEHFDMMGGSGTGGLIVIMFTKLHMSVEEATKEFCNIVATVYKNADLTPFERNGRLRECMESMLKDRNLPADLELVEEMTAGKCAGFVLATPCANVGHTAYFRTYPVHTKPASDVTVVDAVLATCSSQPEFAPVTLGVEHKKQEYIGAGLGANNPIREVITEAHLLFGGDSGVISLLSLGCGHPGIIAMPADGDKETFFVLMQAMMLDCEKRAREMKEHLGKLGIYFRFSIEQGMQDSHFRPKNDLSWVITQTENYLSDSEISQHLDFAVKSLYSPTGRITLARLKHAGGRKAIYKTSPMLARHYIRRHGPWDQMVDGIISSEPGQIIMVIAGMAGCGKTQLVSDLVLEYNPEHNDHFKYVFFIDGSSEASIKSDLIALVQLASPAGSDIDLEGVMSFLQNPRSGRWLIVFDNVDDINLRLSSFLPQCHHGAIVITTRNQALGLLASKTHLHLKLDVMSEEEAISVLLTCAQRSSSTEERKSAAAVAEKLGYLPVALSQAGCYMHEASCPGEAYLVLLEKHRPSLLSRPSRTRQMDCVYAAFSISYQCLSIPLQNLVHLLSFFHFANFPESIVAHAAARHFSDDPFPLIPRDSTFAAAIQLLNQTFLPDGAWSDLTLPEMTRILQSYSIISITSTSTTNLWRIHPLMREWAFDDLLKDQQALFRDAASRLVVSCVEAVHNGRYLAPHIQSIASRLSGTPIPINDGVALGKFLHVMDHRPAARDIILPIYNFLREEHGPNDLRLATVSIELGGTWMYLDWQRAEELLADAIRIRTELLGPEDLQTLKAKSILCRCLGMQGKVQATDALLELVDGLKAELGDVHLDTLDAKNSLAMSYICGGHQAEAEALLMEVLEERRSQLGDSHMETFDAMHNLAGTYARQGRHNEAESILLKVLESRKAQLGERHAYNIAAMYWLANIYNEQGRHSEAISILLEILEAQKAQLGEEHSETLSAMEWLSSAHCAQGCYSDAESLELKVLQSRKARLRESHPDTLNSMGRLAIIYQHQGRRSEAESLLLKLLELRKAELGELHSDTLTTMVELVSDYNELGRYSDAGAFQIKVVEARKIQLGDRHQDTLESMQILAAIYYQQGLYSETESLERAILDTRKMQVGDVHEDTIIAATNLALTYYRLERYSDAESLQVHVMETQRAQLGENHLTTLNSMANLGSVFQRQDRYLDAMPLQLKVLEERKLQLGEAHKDTLDAMSALYMTFCEQGNYSEAEPLALRLVELQKEQLGGSHPSTLGAISKLAWIYFHQGRYSECEPLLSGLLETERSHQGKAHPDTLLTMENLAITYFQEGRFSDAESLEVELVEILKAEHTGTHPLTLRAMTSLAETYLAQNRYSDAEPLQVHVMETQKVQLGEKHLDTLNAMADLGSTFRRQDRYLDAVALQLRVLEERKLQLGEAHKDTLDTMEALCMTFREQDNYSEAEPLAFRLMEMRKEQHGDVHPLTLSTMASLADIYHQQGRYSESKSLQISILDARRSQLGDAHPDTMLAMRNLAATYVQEGHFLDVVPLELELVEILKAKLTETDPLTLEAMSNLAVTYLAQDRYSEAEPLQIKVYEGRKVELGESHPDTLQAMRLLACTYFRQSRYLEAEALEVKALGVYTQLKGEDSLEAANSAKDLAWTYCFLGRLEEAKDLVVKSEKIFKCTVGMEDPQYVDTTKFLEFLDRLISRLSKRRWYQFKPRFSIKKKWFHFK